MCDPFPPRPFHVTCVVCNATFLTGSGHVCKAFNVAGQCAVYVRTRQIPARRAAVRAAMHVEPEDFCTCITCRQLVPPADVEDHPCDEELGVTRQLDTFVRTGSQGSATYSIAHDNVELWPYE